MKVMGLDISTSCTGVCIIDSDIEPDGKGSNILFLDRIEFKKCKTFFEKADVVKQFLKQLESNTWFDTRQVPAIDMVAVEEPLMGFRPGMSSAATITMLMRFNGIVSYIARDVTKIDPVYISSAHARKLCGIKLQRTSIAGMSQKEQVFKHMVANDLSHVVWDKKKNGADVDWNRDATDAYVIARACGVMNKTKVV